MGLRVALLKAGVGGGLSNDVSNAPAERGSHPVLSEHWLEKLTGLCMKSLWFGAIRG